MAVAQSVDVAALLEEMLGIPSVTGETAAMSQWLAARLSDAGFDVSLDNGSVVAQWGTGAREIMLVGHLDTVSGEIEVRREGDELWGRGAVDAKGPLAAAISAVMQQRRDGPARFTLVAVPDEEGDSIAASRLAKRSAPECLVILEPSGWDAITVGYRGSVVVQLRVEQSLSHRAGPHESAPGRLVTLLSDVQRWLASRAVNTSAFERCDMSILDLASSCDGITDAATARIQFRVPESLSADALMSELQSRWQSGVITRESGVDAVRTSRGSSLARSLARSIRRNDGNVRYLVKTGTADLNILVPAWECPAVAYGPGQARFDHTPEERISVSELQRGAEILTGALAELNQ